MDYLVIRTRETQIFCMWGSGNIVLGNLVHLSEEVFVSSSQGNVMTPEAIYIYILHSLLRGSQGYLPTPNG